MQYETSEFLYELMDDGTLDTVVDVTDLETGETRTERIDCETAAHFRPFTETTFADMCDVILDDVGVW